MQCDGATRLDAFPSLTGKRYFVPPEYGLLYHAGNLEPPLGDDQQAVLVQPSLRWDKVLALSDYHGVNGLVRGCLRERCPPGAVPPAVMRALDAWQRSVRLQYLLLPKQLALLLGACSAVGVEPIFLKGAALVTGVYRDPTLRPMGDIDLLVSQKEVPSVEAAIIQFGFVRETLDASDEVNNCRGYHRRYGDRERRRLPIELHWDTCEPLERRDYLYTAHLQRRTICPPPAGVEGVPIRTLDTIGQIVYLAMHAARPGHAFSRLIWLVDIAAVIAAAPSLDWPALMDLAERTRTRSATFVTLALAHGLLGARVPEQVLEALRPPSWRLTALNHALNPQRLLSPPNGDRHTLVKYLIVDHPGIATRVLVQRLVPPAPLMRLLARGPKKANLIGAYLRYAGAVSRQVGYRGIVSFAWHRRAARPRPVWRGASPLHGRGLR